MNNNNEPITERQKDYLLNITFNFRPGTPDSFIKFTRKLNPEEFDEKINKLTKDEASVLISDILSGEFKEAEAIIINLMK